MHIDSIPMWTVYIHKIHIKEWSLVKNKFLSIIPWDKINQRKNPFVRESIDDLEHEMTWTDYFLQGSDNSDAYEMDHLGINLQTPVKYISLSLIHI